MRSGLLVAVVITIVSSAYGDWKFSHSEDPMSDEKVLMLKKVSDGITEAPETPHLPTLCIEIRNASMDANGKLRYTPQVYLTMAKDYFCGRSVDVRFGKDAPEKVERIDSGPVLVLHKATMANPRDFVNRMLKCNRVVVRYENGSMSVRTARFDLTTLKQAFRELRDYVAKKSQ